MLVKVVLAFCLGVDPLMCSKQVLLSKGCLDFVLRAKNRPYLKPPKATCNDERELQDFGASHLAMADLVRASCRHPSLLVHFATPARGGIPPWFCFGVVDAGVPPSPLKRPPLSCRA
jgi:hypothetical protein